MFIMHIFYISSWYQYIIAGNNRHDNVTILGESVGAHILVDHWSVQTEEDNMA